MTNIIEQDVNSFNTLATLVVIGSVAMAILLLAPIMVGAYIIELKFSPQFAGYLISADMAGIGFATIPAMFWLNRISWRSVVKFSLITSIMLQIFSAYTTEYEMFMTIRFLSGLCSGTIISVCLACFGYTLKPDRSYAFWVAVQLLIGAIGLAIFPQIIQQSGVKIVFYALAVSLSIALYFVKYIPVSLSNKSDNSIENHQVHNTNSIVKIAMGIAGLFLFYIALSGLWAFIERIGVSGGLEPMTIGYILAIASIFGIAGALTASMIDTRWGRLIPISIGVVILVIGMLMLLNVKSDQLNVTIFFVSGALLFKYAWTYILPYFLAAISGQDKSGRSIIITNIFVGGGMASGPAIAVQFIQGDNYSTLITLGIGCMIGCFLLFLPLIITNENDPTE